MSATDSPAEAAPERGLLPSRALVGFVILLTGLGELSTQIYAPSLSALASDFGVGTVAVQATLSAFIVAYGCGQLVYGPLSDRFGRRPVLMAGLAVYLAATLACLAASSIEALIAARALQGGGASAALVLARAITRDVWGREAAPIIAVSTLAIAVSTVVSPLAGGLLALTPLGWRASFVLLLLLGLAVLAALLLGYRETHLTPDRDAIRPARLAANYAGLFRDAGYMGHVLTLMLAYGALFSFISGAPLVAVGSMGLAPWQYGAGFGLVVSGLCLGMLAARMVTGRLGLVRIMALGAALMLSAMVVALAVALSGPLGPAGLLLPQLPLTIGAGLVLPNAVAGAVMPQGMRAGLASGLLGFLQMAGGAAFGILVARLFDGTALPMLAVQLAAVGAMALVFTVLVARRE